MTREYIDETYGVAVEEFLEHYIDGYSLEDIAERCGISEGKAQEILSYLGLSLNMEERGQQYLAVILQLEAEQVQDSAHKVITENDYLIRKLAIVERALQRSRDELNVHRKNRREDVRSDVFYERVATIVEQSVKPRQFSFEPKVIYKGRDSHKDHTRLLVLSDIHAEELVDKRDVGLTNEFNWEVLNYRITKLFQTYHVTQRGEERGVIFLLGDVVTGLIHDALENATKPLAEAIHDLAELLYQNIYPMQQYHKEIEIHFCSGNHERLSQNIKSNSKGFDFGYLFAQILRAKVQHLPKVSMTISTTGLVHTMVGDKVLGGHHGDMFRGSKSDMRTYVIQESFKNTLGVDVWHIVEGHTHKFSYHNTNRGASIVNGSVIGSNAYGHTNGFIALRPSQTIVNFFPNGDIEGVTQVFLD